MKTRQILLGSLAVLALAACSNDENIPADGVGARATFTASIDGHAATRAFDQTWDKADAIGITGTSGDKAYANVQYVTTNGDGNFTVATPGEEIYYQDDNEVNFTAYYPWNASTTIPANTLEQSKQKTFDFLHAEGKGKKANPNVAFLFHHKMTKLVLTIKKGADISFDEVKAAKLMLEGFKWEGSFDGLTGTTTATGNPIVMWEFANNAEAEEAAYNAPKVENSDESVSYTLILFPQEFAAPLTFSAKLAGKQTFSAELDFSAANNSNAETGTDKNAWVAGWQYNVSVTLHKTRITVNGCQIAAWNEVTLPDTPAM